MFLLIANTLLPLLALWWLIAPNRGNRAEWLAKALLVVSYLYCVMFASVWLVPSVFAPYAYAALFVIALALSWLVMRRRPWAPATRGAKIRIGACIALSIVCIAIGTYGALGLRPVAADAVELDFPLRDGTFYIVSGGSNALVNAHLVAPPRYRGQSYAVDVVAVDRLGQRATGLLPEDPAAYVIFGKPVHAPCDGAVKRVVDGLPDHAPPHTDRKNLAGNHVLLECGAAEVLLAHLRNGSVAVKAGDAVRRGDRLGEVGNSGNTSEPHLHLHAQRAGEGGKDLLDREPLAMKFGGRAATRGILRAD